MPDSSSCPSEKQLQQFALGLLAEAEGEWVGQHLARCDACLEFLPRLQAADELVDALAGVRATPPPSGIAIDELRRQLGALRPAGVGATQGDDFDPGTPTPPPPPPREPTSAPELRDLLAAPEGPDEIGRLGPYAVVELLGAGGMGVVFRARQQRPQRVVALKVIRTGARASSEQRGRFRTEAEAVARLQHPGIVQIYEAGEREGLPYFTMEYVDGGSLADKLAAAPLLPREATEVVEALARAIHHAHECGIVHRDLKPSNVLLTAGGVVKIADFGLSKQFSAAGGHTESGAILGTPAYAAPEQAVGGAVGPAADVYALGAILYECLTGRPPFRAATILETLDQVRSRDPMPPSRLQPGVPHDLETVCLKCLAKESAKRYGSAAELADDLRRCLVGEPIRARPVGVTERVLKWARRKPALAALVGVSALAVLVLVLGAAVYSVRLRNEVRRAEAGEERARRQEQRASANYSRGRAAITRLLGRLGDRRLADVPRLRELRQDLLEDTLAFYQGALRDLDDPDPEVRLDVASAYEQMATAQHLLGRLRPAEQNCRRAAGLLEGLDAAVRDRPESRTRLAACYNRLGMALTEQGRQVEGETYYRKALAFRKRLVKAQPADTDRLSDLAESYHNVGVVCQLQSRLAEAEPEYARAVALRTQLVRDRPRQVAHQMGLAESEQNLGLIHAMTQRPVTATAAYQRAEALLAPLVRAHPRVSEYALTLASVCINRSYLLAGRPREALAVLDQAVRLTDEVFQREPDSYLARARRLNAHGARAQVHEGQGRWADAIEDWEVVVAREQGPSLPLHRLGLALALTHTGHHKRAAAIAGDVAGAKSVANDLRYATAAVYTLCATAARADSRLPAAERAARAEHYAVRAVAVLRRLHARGYFKNPKQMRELRADADLGPLHKRDDFRDLLAEIDRAKKPK